MNKEYNFTLKTIIEWNEIVIQWTKQIKWLYTYTRELNQYTMNDYSMRYSQMKMTWKLGKQIAQRERVHNFRWDGLESKLTQLD